ncbi:NUDIX domain-containing protein [Antarctobacter heliothermus]|uniref:ADP-ribose pyrophosphatase YjhB, NUDIX family n=1 Tax=Antarctobacter heliothermus TaxID=74033 RepID=A0A239CBS6_9RHOB|nr:NUDIX hydrolase [Antarctobacter heliothermus]SNS17696.1 ADP-ribose pyrophosphatase YjhB, NUDIX family [Antarctobacter heliothermus]
MPSPRIATRAVILHEDRLLLVNAWRDVQSDLWCAPGGGAERHASLPDNLIREVYEETGLTIAVGAPCLINEFHDPKGRFHQVEVFFRATITAGALSDLWKDPEGIVHTRCFFTRAEVAKLRLKPSSLPDVAWGTGLVYDPLEPILR